jgi:hypothetical protein
MNGPNQFECYITLQERLASDKHSILLGLLASYEGNKVVAINGPISLSVTLHLAGKATKEIRSSLLGLCRVLKKIMLL